MILFDLVSVICIFARIMVILKDFCKKNWYLARSWKIFEEKLARRLSSCKILQESCKILLDNCSKFSWGYVYTTMPTAHWNSVAISFAKPNVMPLQTIFTIFIKRFESTLFKFFDVCYIVKSKYVRSSMYIRWTDNNSPSQKSPK